MNSPRKILNIYITLNYIRFDERARAWLKIDGDDDDDNDGDYRMYNCTHQPCDWLRQLRACQFSIL